MNPFKNHKIQIGLVKTPVQNADPQVAEEPPFDAQQIADTAVKLVGAVGAVIAANKVLSTVCEIAVIAAKAKFK